MGIRCRPTTPVSKLAMARPLSFIARVRKRVASSAIGASTVRGMGPKGTAARARTLLARVNLNRFGVDSKRKFDRVFNRVTESFRRSLPRGARHWGLARKLLNIFLRDTTYNRFLSQRFGLWRVERWLEVPLDSHVGKQLRSSSEGQRLPRWKTVIGLTPSVSAEFQKVATAVARRRRVTRADLDVYYWRNPAMANQPLQRTRRKRRAAERRR